MQAWDSSTHNGVQLRYFEQGGADYQALPDTDSLPSTPPQSAACARAIEQALKATQAKKAQMHD
eukprot:8672506-Karenia_brevis.AAC.1